jgi:hypothetical protein
MSKKVSKQEPKTLGIPPAVRGALQAGHEWYGDGCPECAE